MESSDQPDAPDWPLLSALFAHGGNHRHKMGLQRANAREFYAPTPARGSIRRKKQVVLDAEGERRIVITREGHLVATEFADFLGLSVGEGAPNDESGWRVENRCLSLALEPDLLLVQPPDWSLVWANVCFPSRWSLEEMTGRPLSWIHAAVPNLNAELGSKISAFFERLNPGEGWRRANWGLSATCRRDQHPAVPIPTLTPTTPPDQIFVRVEDQHLVKLPETGAIAFGIRIYSYAWPAVRQNHVFAASVIDQLRSMSPEIARYKAISEIIPVMSENLSEPGC